MIHNKINYITLITTSFFSQFTSKKKNTITFDCTKVIHDTKGGQWSSPSREQKGIMLEKLDTRQRLEDMIKLTTLITPKVKLCVPS